MASNHWNALLANSLWYVPAGDLLAYRLDSDTPSTPTPAGDQTLWSIGAVRNGRFSGRSVARITDVDGGETQSLTEMKGLLTSRGQVRIRFTTPIGSTITGIGQLRRVNDQPSMEMQMITGGGGSYTTHWAYMLRASKGTVPPEPRSMQGGGDNDRSSSYRWISGTTWSMAIRGSKKNEAAGTFTISGYRNGYFWGSGSNANGQSSFEVLGSVTPEGNLFFNAIDSQDFSLDISQGGMLFGDRKAARVRLHSYDAVVGEVKRPLTLRLISGPRSGLVPSAAEDLLIDGGLRPGNAQRRTAQASGPAPLAFTASAVALATPPPLASTNAPFHEHTWLDHATEPGHGTHTGLQQAEVSSGWSL